MTHEPKVFEKLYRVWSGKKEQKIAIRIQYSVAEENGCTIYELGNREEWD
ncbi:MAG: hypothetical protein ACRD7E_23380 [Bryobacteraceae bacterium]